MSRLRALLVFGTRPEGIKLAPVVQECLRRADAVETLICLTGQHREMLRQVTDYFGIHADCDLDLMRPNQTLADLTARCIAGLDDVLARYAPQCVVAQGDTTTVMCASLAAFYRRIPFVHVEAGLRTGNLQSPWPEELNRRIAGLTSALHCAPTQRAASALLSEGVAPDTICVTGNTVIDALLWTLDRERRDQQWAEKYRYLADRRMVLVTGHRRENFGQGFENICRALATLADRFADVDFVYPVHLNPNVQEPVHRILAGRSNVQLIAPCPYPEFVWLMDRATLIVSDSGGVQEEAPSLRKPVLLMRDTTERPEAVEAGAVELVGTSLDSIVSGVSRLLTDPLEYKRRQLDTNPYGDGHAAVRTVDFILQKLSNSN